MLLPGTITKEVRIIHTSPKLSNAFAIGVISTSSNCGNSINHCVMITGYDVVNGMPVWNVRNSYVSPQGFPKYEDNAYFWQVGT